MDYHLRPIGKTCAATGEPLVPGTRCFSVLCEKSGELVRLDYSEQAWEGPPKGSLGHWQCFVPEDKSERPREFDAESMLGYFEQLVEDANPAQEKLCYVLALYLLQKRRLRLDGSRVEEGAEWLQLHGSGGEGPYEVRDQQLSQEEIQTLQSALTQQLETEWNAA